MNEVEPYGNPRYYERVSVTAFFESPDAAMSGTITVSAETRQRLNGFGSPARPYQSNTPYIVELILLDPEKFVTVCEDLPAFVRDCVFQFYFLGRPPAQIGEVLGSNRRFVEEALRLADKAVIASACGVEPDGIHDIWAKMRQLHHQRRRDAGDLEVKEPLTLGQFVVKLESEDFPLLFAPRELNGSIVRAM